MVGHQIERPNVEAWKAQSQKALCVTIRVHLTVCTVDFTVFTVAVTVFFTFVFLNFESENTGYRYR